MATFNDWLDAYYDALARTDGMLLVEALESLAYYGSEVSDNDYGDYLQRVPAQFTQEQHSEFIKSQIPAFILLGKMEAETSDALRDLDNVGNFPGKYGFFQGFTADNVEVDPFTDELFTLSLPRDDGTV